MTPTETSPLERLKAKHPEKFVPEDKIFENLRPGDRIFLGTACAEPQYLVQALVNYIRGNPKAVVDSEILQVWTLGVAPYATDRALRPYLRHNSFFVGNNTRDAVNSGQADYTPIFLSQVPGLFRRKLVPIDVALIQVSPPDEHGYFSLGVSIDIVKPAVENASLIIAQINPRMPRSYGDGFIHISQIDFAVPHDEGMGQLGLARAAPPLFGRVIGADGGNARLTEDTGHAHLVIPPLLTRRFAEARTRPAEDPHPPARAREGALSPEELSICGELIRGKVDIASVDE